MLARVRPRDPAAKMRRRMAAGELAGLTRLDAKLKAMKAELKTAVLATGSHLMDIHGIGPAGAARTLADVGDVARFPDRNHFASRAGTAPIDASSGEHTRHRLSRAGNRRINHVLYIAGIARYATTPPAGPATGGNCSSPKLPWKPCAACAGACPGVACRQLVADAMSRGLEQAGPGGHSGTTLKSSAADLTPDIGSSDQPLPGPAPLTLPPAVPARNPAGPGTAATPRRRAGGVSVERPTGRTTLTPTSAGAHSKASRTHWSTCHPGWLLTP